MSIPVTCHECGDFVGVADGMAWLGGDLSTTYWGSCPGAGKHKASEQTERLSLFGLVKKVTVKYPETHSISSWSEYVGPANLFSLWCAIVFGTKRYPNGSYDGVLVNHKWVWWDLDTGFYGDGLAELMHKAQ